MEQLIGFMCLLSVVLLSFVFVGVVSIIRGKIPSRVVNDVPQSLVCHCPKCRTDLYHDLKALIAKNPNGAALLDVSIECARCHTRSLWNTLGSLPLLSKHRQY